MGHVKDRWTVPGPSGRRVKGPRYGRGKRWLASWVEPGGTERTRAFASKDGALAHLAAVDVEIRSGSYVQASSVTFEAYARAWLAHQVHQSPGTAKQARGVLERHAFGPIGGLPVQAVTRAHVQQLVVAAYQGSGGSLGPGAVRILHVYVKAVFAAAVEDRLIAVSPVRRINLPKRVRSLVVPLTVAQVRAVAERVPAHLEGMVWLGAGSGLRPGELRALTVDRVAGDSVRVDRQLTEQEGSQRVVFGPPKTPSSFRMVVLSPGIAKRLLVHLERFPPGADGLVFTSARGRPLRRGHLSYAWKVGSAGLDLPKRSGWHDLRHHHASLLIAAGLSPRAVADRLGHGDPSETLRTYSHLWPSDQGRILDAIDDAHDQSDPMSDGPETDQP